MSNRDEGGAPSSGSFTFADCVVYTRQVAVTLPPPDMGGPSTFAPEAFCVVPDGARFFVLSYSYGDSIPDPTYDGEKAWRGFLTSFRVLDAKGPGK